jgi:hypothetical protein
MHCPKGNIVCCCCCCHAGLPKLLAWGEAVMAHPAVAGSIAPPDPSQPYMEQLLANYKEYIAKRKAAAAAK